jgi:hypothetical protein
MSTYNREYYLKNREKRLQDMKNYHERIKHTETYQERSARTRFKYRETHPERIIFLSAKARAERDGFDFSIDYEDIKIPTVCPLMGIALTNIRGKGRVQTNPSLDRIDSSKGYIKGNIQVISELANRMKQDATSEQLIAFAKGILQIYNAPRT